MKSSRSGKLGRPLNRYDQYKVIALLAMVIDHIGLYFFPEYPVFRAIGRLAFPLFAMLVGCAEHQPISRVMVVWAVVLTLLHSLLWSNFEIDVLGALMLAKWMVAETRKCSVWSRAFMMTILWLPLIALPVSSILEYGLFSPCLALMASAATYHRQSVGWCVALLVLFFAWQIEIFGFVHDPLALIVVGFVVMMCLWWVTVSRHHLGDSWNGWGCPRIFRWLSRHTLTLYGIHFTAFTVLAVVLYA